MRILIISYHFAPQNLIGAVRATKLAKYLQRMGHEVTVLCGEGLEPWRVDPTLERDMRELHDVHVVREVNYLREIKRRKRSGEGASGGGSAGASGGAAGRRGVVARAANTVYLSLGVMADISFRLRVGRELKRLNGAYDAVFSSYSPLSVCGAARAAKRRGLARKWIADFRDEASASLRIMNWYRNRCLRAAKTEADIVTAVSGGLFEQMGLHGRVLSNGFDREDMPAPERGDARRFRAVYCGQFIMGRKGVAGRDLTPCLRALAALVERGEIKPDEIELVYAGGEGGSFRAQAEGADLGSAVIDLGPVSRERSLALQGGADMLMLASRNDAGLTGVLTGKLFEYLMAGKPIACCVSGALPQSELRRVLGETGAGFCYEEACAQKDAPEMLEWLSGVIRAWRAGGGNARTRVDMYDYRTLAGTLADWISE